MDKIEMIKVFTRVAEVESFTKAADQMGLPKASVSNAVQDLEELVGTRLLHRTTRKVQLTQDGMTFFERCKDLLTDFEEVETLFQKGSAPVRGRIRIDMPKKIAENLVIPRLPQFLEKYPALDLEISSTDRRVDVIREGFDLVIRVGNLADSGLIAKPVGKFETINCVSPGYIKKYGKPKKLEDLKNHRLIEYASTLGSKPMGFEYFDGERYRNFPMPVSITVNNTDAYTLTCLHGLGIIQAPKVGLKNYLESGQLIEVLSNLKVEPMPVSIIYPHRRQLARRVQIFMDWLMEILSPAIK